MSFADLPATRARPATAGRVRRCPHTDCWHHKREGWTLPRAGDVAVSYLEGTATRSPSGASRVCIETIDRSQRSNAYRGCAFGKERRKGVGAGANPDQAWTMPGGGFALNRTIHGGTIARSDRTTHMHTGGGDILASTVDSPLFSVRTVDFASPKRKSSVLRTKFPREVRAVGTVDISISSLPRDTPTPCRCGVNPAWLRRSHAVTSNPLLPKRVGKKAMRLG